MATRRLIDRARAAGIDTIVLTPTLGDFNDDLRVFGRDGLRNSLAVQLAPEDTAALMEPSFSAGTAA